MGKRGPKRKPDVLRYLDGKRVSRDAGVEGVGVPFIPNHLMQGARECILRVQESMPPGLYARADSYLLACFGVAWAIHQRAVTEINKPDFKWTFKNDKGVERPSPWLKIANTQARLVAELGARLGLDPRSREELQKPVSPSQSKFHGLIGPPLIEQDPPESRLCPKPP